MRVAVVNNVISVITDIKLEVAKKNLIDSVIRNEKGEPVYKIEVNPNGAGAISRFGIVCNSVTEDGYLAAVVIEELGTTLEDIKLKYGKAVIAAKKFCPIFANAAAEAQAEIEEAFADQQ